MKRSIAFSPQVHIIGEVKYGKEFDAKQLYCKWSFRVGKNWRLLAGKEYGETYQEEISSVSDTFMWDHPIDLHYVSRSIRGWPKIFVEVWEVNDDRHSISGYGEATLPTTPGHHLLEVHCWRPYGNESNRSASQYLGARPELQFKDLLFSSSTRFGLEAESSGIVVLDIGLILKDFKLHGVDLGKYEEIGF